MSVNRGTISANEKAARRFADQSEAREPGGSERRESREISYSVVGEVGRVASQVVGGLNIELTPADHRDDYQNIFMKVLLFHC